MRAPVRAAQVPAGLTVVADRVERRLGEVLDDERRRWTEFDPDVTPFIDALADLARAGAKRIRPAFCHWAYVGAGGDPDDPLVVDVGVAFELLQAFALLHDDVMDGSATTARRPHRPPGVRGAPHDGQMAGRAAAVRRGGGDPGRRPGPRLRRPDAGRRPARRPGDLARAADRAQRRPVSRRPGHGTRRPRPRPGPPDRPVQVGQVHHRAPAPHRCRPGRPARRSPGADVGVRRSAGRGVPAAGRHPRRLR